MSGELIRYVMRLGGAWLLPLALGGFLVAGIHGGVSVLAGGVLALGNLWLLGRASDRALGLFIGRRFHPLWVVSVGLRHLAMFAVLGLLLWSGRVHPGALIVGLSVLPPVLIAAALRGIPERS